MKKLLMMKKMLRRQWVKHRLNLKTGDVTDMYLWLTIFGAALVSAAAVAGTSRRRNEN